MDGRVYVQFIIQFPFGQDDSKSNNLFDNSFETRFRRQISSIVSIPLGRRTPYPSSNFLFEVEHLRDNCH
jgi:hypothetical protein